MDVVKSSLFKSAGIAVGALILGLLGGLVADDFRTDHLDSSLKQSQLETETFVVTQNYLEESDNYCEIVENQIPELADRNTEIGRNLQSYTSSSISEQSTYRFIRDKYYVNQLRLYNLLRDFRERCDQRELDLVLFLFDSSTDSRRQGAALTEYRTEYDSSTYVFSYNLESRNSTVVDILRTDYNVSSGPILVLNSNRTLRGYKSVAELRDLL